MIKTYGEGQTMNYRAQHVWQILCPWVDWKMSDPNLPAGNEGLLTYGHLAELIGLGSESGLLVALPLRIIGHLCIENNIPTLNAVVVNKHTKEPGHGVVLTPGHDFKDEVAKVLKHNWTAFMTPSIEDFKATYERNLEHMS